MLHGIYTVFDSPFAMTMTNFIWRKCNLTHRHCQKKENTLQTISRIFVLDEHALALYVLFTVTLCVNFDMDVDNVIFSDFLVNVPVLIIDRVL